MRIGVVGLGYVGLPLVVAFCEAGHEVVGVDTDSRMVEALASGRSHIEDVPDASLAAISRRFRPTTRYAELAQTDAVIVAVPTPLTPNRLRAAAIGGFEVAAREQLPEEESLAHLALLAHRKSNATLIAPVS